MPRDVSAIMTGQDLPFPLGFSCTNIVRACDSQSQVERQKGDVCEPFGYAADCMQTPGAVAARFECEKIYTVLPSRMCSLTVFCTVGGEAGQPNNGKRCCLTLKLTVALLIGVLVRPS